MKCDVCKVKYPDEIMSAGICGICALAWTNQVHGANRKKFDGEMAEHFRQEAIAHRKKIGVKK